MFPHWIAFKAVYREYFSKQNNNLQTHTKKEAKRNNQEGNSKTFQKSNLKPKFWQQAIMA